MNASKEHQRTSERSNDASIYLKLPVLVKTVQIILGIVCVGIAAHDLVTNFEDVTARTALSVTRHKLRILNPVWKVFKEVVTPITGSIEPLEKIFVDQLGSRVLFLSVSVIFLLISAIQLIWFPASIFTGPLKSRIISGVICHLIAAALHITSSLVLLARIDLLGDYFYNATAMQTAANVGLGTAAVYIISILLALWSFIGDSIDRRDPVFGKYPPITGSPYRSRLNH